MFTNRSLMPLSLSYSLCWGNLLLRFGLSPTDS